MPFKPRDIEAVKIAGYNKRTVRVNRFSQRVKQKLTDVDIYSGGDGIIQLLSDKRILLEDAQVLDEPIGSHGQYSNTIFQDDDFWSIHL